MNLLQKFPIKKGIVIDNEEKNIMMIIKELK